MDILNILKRLRDDLKTWVTNNLNALNIKINNKVDKIEGKVLSTNDFTDAYKDKVDSALQFYTETDPTVPAWAKHPNKPTYTASEVGALPADTIIPSIDGLATETYVNTKLASLVNSAPETLNTLDELAAALGDDENFATTVTNQIASKLDASELPTAITDALSQAKASGEFDGKNGETPVRGTDYWTDADKAEIKTYVDEVILGGVW